MRVVLLLFWCAFAYADRAAAGGLSLAAVNSGAPFWAEVIEVSVRGDASNHAVLTIKLCRDDGSSPAIVEPQAKLSQMAFAMSLRVGCNYQWPQVIADFEQEMRRKKAGLKRLKWHSDRRLKSCGQLWLEAERIS